jgi:hypothetical protein
MPHRRKPSHLITPAYEDNGLFKSPVHKVVVGLVPQAVRNNRQDLVVRGFVEPEIEVSVIFAGRRARQTAPLQAQLRRLLFHARAQARGWDQEALDRTRLPVRIEGAWRSRFSRDPEGWETRSHELLVARWALIDETGATQHYGEGPARASTCRSVPQAASGNRP